MSTQKTADKCFDSIMDLQGFDAFITMLGHLRKLLQKKEKCLTSSIPLPHFLWVARRGGGVSTLANAFAEYLYAAEAIEFCGNRKYFEHKLRYNAPEEFFSELTRLNNALLDAAGHHRDFKGVVCIDINEWMEHTSETHFSDFLDYVASNSDKTLTIFYIHTDDRDIIENIELALLSRMRLESVVLNFPNAKELAGFVENKLFNSEGFLLTKDAQVLLAQSIDKITAGKQFYGFKTLEQMAEYISRSAHMSDLDGNEISADALSCSIKTYVERFTKPLVGTKNNIGFFAIRRTQNEQREL